MKLLRKAQAATEVAIFGAIIIFLIGMIIRTTISSQYAQNQNFKAMRFALAKSLESSKAGKTERNNATVLYIEDRLVPDFNKYGSLERTPFLATGSGSMSHLMMYPIDEVDVNDSIPKLDVYINGQYYPFTTAALRAKLLVPPADRAIKYEGSPRADVPSPVHYKGWDYRCLCTSTTDANPRETCYACPMFYTLVPKGTVDYCDPNVSIVSDKCKYLSKDERFDLNRNDDFSDDPKEVVSDRSAVARSMIAWQWDAERGIVGDDNVGISRKIDASKSLYPVFDIDQDRKEETIYGLNRVNLDDVGLSQGMTADMKLDVRDQIQAAKQIRPTIVEDLKMLQSQGIIVSIMVSDYQDGDIDLSFDNNTPGSRRGVQTETAIYTRMRQEKGEQKDRGTYFLVKDGKAYNPETGKFVRSVNKRDQVDLVERHVLLSNNTWRFCPRNGGTVRLACIAGLVGADGKCAVAPNPVEVCVNDTGDGEFSGCFSPANVAKTCMDTKSNMIYVRSRIVNRGGHKWITDATDKRPEINIR